MVVRQLLARYASERTLKPNTESAYRYVFARLGILDIAVPDDLADRLAAIPNVKSRRVATVVCNAVLGTTYKAPSESYAIKQLPDLDDVKAALLYCSQRVRAQAMLYGGLRLGEAAGLSRVAVEGSTVVIDRQMTRYGLSEPKSGQSRVVVVPHWLAVEVADLSEPISNHTLRNAIAWCSRKTGVPFTSHTLRHLYGTHSIRSGLDPKSLQRQLGHASLDTTMSFYVHTDEDKIRDIWS